MSLVHIFTEPFEILDITDCDIVMTVNEHLTAVITGHIRLEDDRDTFINGVMSQTFIIKALTEDGEEVPLFRGDIREIFMDSEGGIGRITVTVESKTARLDTENHFRMFQGIGQTYRQIADAVLSSVNSVSTIYSKGKGVQAKGFVVQYGETDWQFLKRLASQLNTVLVADCTNDSICFFFGNPAREGNGALDMQECRMRRYINFEGRESVEYVVQSRKMLKLCAQVPIAGNSYYVYKIKTSYKTKEIIFEYILRPANGFRVPSISHEAIRGVSITGEVIEVRDTRIRIRLSSKADYDFGDSLWFPFSTVYSSPDGTGWYCMPEEGDQIRLCVPDSREETAYAVSAVHLDNHAGLRTNVDEKSIRTKYGKEIRFIPKQILITNHQGMSIILDDDEGILIKSNEKVEITSESGIELKGGKINIEGKKGVILMEGPNMLMVRDGIKEQGMNIEHR